MSEVNSSNIHNLKTLEHYNHLSPGTVEHAHAYGTGPRPRGLGAERTSHYIVPVWGAPSYNTLLHGLDKPSYRGHHTITNAYGADAGTYNNTRYVQRPCTGNLGQ